MSAAVSANRVHDPALCIRDTSVDVGLSIITRRTGASSILRRRLAASSALDPLELASLLNLRKAAGIKYAEQDN